MSNLSNTQKTQIDLNSLSDTELLNLAQSLQVLDERKKYNLQEFIYPVYLKDVRYKKHLLFFKAGSFYNERALIAGNRTGKTYSACAEMSFHLNGRYPDSWEGKRFKEPVRAWSVGKTHETTMSILQRYMVGNRYDLGSGMIPKKDIERTTSKSGIQDALQDVYVKHYTNGIYDGLSQLTFKSYVQGIEAFMGESVHVIHLDEEPDPASIYGECFTRTMTTEGIILCTFTPLMGLSEVVLSFLPGGRFPMGGIGPVEEQENDQS